MTAGQPLTGGARAAATRALFERAASAVSPLDAEIERAERAEAEVERLRAQVERVEALAERWRCNCTPSRWEGHADYCDGGYAADLRAALASEFA